MTSVGAEIRPWRTRPPGAPELLAIAFPRAVSHCGNPRSALRLASILSTSACAAEVGSARRVCSSLVEGCACGKSRFAFQRSTWSRSTSSTSIRMARPAAATSSRPSRVRPSPQRRSVSSFSSSRTEWRDVSVRVLLRLQPACPRYEIRRSRSHPRPSGPWVEYFRWRSTTKVGGTPDAGR